VLNSRDHSSSRYYSQIIDKRLWHVGVIDYAQNFDLQDHNATDLGGSGFELFAIGGGKQY
jgi:hypothetical protein